MQTIHSMNSGIAPSDSESALNLAGVRLGRYEILCELASGGMASVYVARAVGVAGFERLVALKLLHPHLAHEEAFFSMFLDEARLAARIRHPNVVATQDISDSEGDGFYIVMDYVEGDHLGSLLGRVARQRRLTPEPIAARILLDALNGLSAAHGLEDVNGEPLHIVHRDVSPQNIVIGTDGVSRLTDFGVAGAVLPSSPANGHEFRGKVAYSSPEQLTTGHSDQRSDLFAMGIVVWECLTSRRLFRAESTAATLSKIVAHPIPAPSSVAPGLAHWDGVLMRALARDPRHRFQTAQEFADAVEEVALSHRGIASPRAVADFLREHVGDKIEDERRRTKAAIVRSNSSHPNIAIPPAPSRSKIAAVPSRTSIPPIATEVAPRISHRQPSDPIAPIQSGIVARDESRTASAESDPRPEMVRSSSRQSTTWIVTAVLLVLASAGIAVHETRHATNMQENMLVSVPPLASADPSVRAVPTPQIAPRSVVPAPNTASVEELRSQPSSTMHRRSTSRVRRSTMRAASMRGTTTSRSRRNRETPLPNPYRF